MFHNWGWCHIIVFVYLEISLNYQKLLDPKHIHACIMNVTRLLFKCFWYILVNLR